MNNDFSSRIKNMFKREPEFLELKVDDMIPGDPEHKNLPRSFQLSDQDFYIDNWYKPPYQSDNKDAHKRLLESYWTEACMEKYRSSISLVRPVAQKWDQKSENWVRVPNHPIEQLIDRPNEYQTTEEFFEVIIENLWLTGNALITIKDTRTSGTVALESLNTDLVKMKLGTQNGKLVEGYEVSKDGWGTGSRKSRFVPRKDMIHIRLVNSDKLEWGISPLESVKNVQETEADAVEYNRSYMHNTGRPSFVLVSEDPLSTKQRRDLQQALAEDNSRSRSGLPLVLTHGIKPISLGKTPVELDYIKADRLNGERISAIFQIPSPLINITENATLANVSEFIRLFWTAGVVPKLTKIFQAISKYWVHPRFGEEYRLWFDTSAIPELMEHIVQKTEIMERYIDLGYTINELNAFLELGLPYNPVGNIRMYKGQVMDWGGMQPPAQTNVTPADLVNSAITGTLGPNTNPGKYSAKDLDKIWASTDFSRKTLVDIFTNKVVDQLVADFSVISNLPPVVDEKYKKSVEAVFRNSEPEWKSLLQKVWYDVSKYFMEDFGFRYGKEGKALANTKGISKGMDVKEIDALVDSKLTAIQNHLVNVVMDTAEHISDEGYSLSDKFQEIALVLAKKEAKTILEDEVAAASNYGNKLAAEKIGLVYKVWHTRRDKKEAITHVTMEGEKRLLSDKYSNKLMFPGDPNGSLKEIKNNRCFETYE